jgi:hypothetical protein
MRPSAEETATGKGTYPAGAVPRSRLFLLFLLFFLICWGLGYASLNRIDWRMAPGGLTDVRVYAGIVTGAPPVDPNDHMQFRVLIPYLARPFYHLAKNHLGSWDPVMFGLLVVNSCFVAATATVLLAVVCGEIGSYAVALGAALLFLLNFAIPNLRLVGLIDAGEGFFLMLLVWSLLREHYWTLPIWGVLGAAAKESFVPFLIVFTFSWWICSRKTSQAPRSSGSRMVFSWIIFSWIAAFASMSTVQYAVTHVFRSPLQFGLDLHHNTAYGTQFLSSLFDRNLWYIFLWLLPLSAFRLSRFSRNWRVAVLATTITAFALDAYYGGEPGTVGRALFSIAGPLLTASAALLLFGEKPPVAR